MQLPDGAGALTFQPRWYNKMLIAGDYQEKHLNTI